MTFFSLPVARTTAVIAPNIAEIPDTKGNAATSSGVHCQKYAPM